MASLLSAPQAIAALSHPANRGPSDPEPSSHLLPRGAEGQLPATTELQDLAIGVVFTVRGFAVGVGLREKASYLCRITYLGKNPYVRSCQILDYG